MGSSKKIKKQSLDYVAESLFINIPACRFKIIPFSLLYQLVECNIINDLYKFDLLHALSFKKHDVKKIFYHYIISSICNCIINNNDMLKIVIQYHEDDLDKCEVISSSSKFQFLSFIQTILRKISNLLPIIVYQRSIADIEDSIKSTGNRQELVHDISNILNTTSNHTFTFSKIKNFIKNYDLVYLDRELFGKLKAKNLLI
jgi:hypothetical protein